MSCEAGNVDGIVCINKADLIDPSRCSRSSASTAGWATAAAGERLDRPGDPALRLWLKDKTTVFTGQSGVGRSSLLNVVQEGLALKEPAEVSSDTGKKGAAYHPGRRAVAAPRAEAGWSIPGIRQLQLWNVKSG